MIEKAQNTQFSSIYRCTAGEVWQKTDFMNDSSPFDPV